MASPLIELTLVLMWPIWDGMILGVSLGGRVEQLAVSTLTPKGVAPSIGSL